MRFVSLFAGVGGFDLGFEQAGMTCVGQVEIDKKAMSVLQKHWPDVPKHDDVQTAKEWADDIGLTGNVDVVAGGFPCQDLSIAGRRAGLDGARSGLFYDAINFATHVKAKWVVLENVPGLFSSNNGRDFMAVIREMRLAGFDYVEWRIFDSQFYGVPQRRRRVYIVGHIGNPGRFPIFAERESSERDSCESITKGQDFARGSTESSGITYVKVIRSGARDEQGNLPPEVWAERSIAPTLNRMDNTGESRATVVAVQSDTVRRLTPVECERLQGFPDNWTEGQADTTRYKQMGNAVTVNVTYTVGKMILESDN